MRSSFRSGLKTIYNSIVLKYLNSSFELVKKLRMFKNIRLFLIGKMNQIFFIKRLKWKMHTSLCKIKIKISQFWYYNQYSTKFQSSSDELCRERNFRPYQLFSKKYWQCISQFSEMGENSMKIYPKFLKYIFFPKENTWNTSYKNYTFTPFLQKIPYILR